MVFVGGRAKTTKRINRSQLLFSTAKLSEQEKDMSASGFQRYQKFRSYCAARAPIPFVMAQRIRNQALQQGTQGAGETLRGPLVCNPACACRQWVPRSSTNGCLNQGSSPGLTMKSTQARRRTIFYPRHVHTPSVTPRNSFLSQAQPIPGSEHKPERIWNRKETRGSSITPIFPLQRTRKPTISWPGWLRCVAPNLQQC